MPPNKNSWLEYLGLGTIVYLIYYKFKSQDADTPMDPIQMRRQTSQAHAPEEGGYSWWEFLKQSYNEDREYFGV
jgi:hypothetical protein